MSTRRLFFRPLRMTGRSLGIVATTNGVVKTLTHRIGGGLQLVRHQVTKRSYCHVVSPEYWLRTGYLLAHCQSTEILYLEIKIIKRIARRRRRRRRRHHHHHHHNHHHQYHNANCSLSSLNTCEKYKRKYFSRVWVYYWNKFTKFQLLTLKGSVVPIRNTCCNIKKICILSAQCFNVLHTIITKKSSYLSRLVNLSVFLIDTDSVLCEVRTEALYCIKWLSFFKGLKNVSADAWSDVRREDCSKEVTTAG